MKTIRRAVGSTVVAALLGVVPLPGCGGMSPKVEAPSSAPEAAPAQAAPTSSLAAKDEAEAEPATLADAEALLEKARADLDRWALNEPGAARGATGGAPPAPASAPPAPAPQRAEAKPADKAASADGAAAPPAKEVNTCDTACKAFASLARAGDAVCRLDTDGGKRCERARQIRADASHRVASCGCAK